MLIQQPMAFCELHDEYKFSEPGGTLRCRSCRAEWRRSYYEKNRNTILSQRKIEREEKKEHLALVSKKYRTKNKDKILKRRRAHYNRHKEKIQERDRKTRHPLYRTWDSMIQRCCNPSSRSYPMYGGRGIGIHEPWRQSFGEFLKYIEDELGPKPSPSHSLDRYPNRNGDYAPGNLRWATRVQQQNNTRRNLNYRLSIHDGEPIYHDGRCMTLRDFSETTGIPLIVVKYRYSQHPVSHWLLWSEVDNRYYKYRGHYYNMSELCLISGLSFGTMSGRIKRYNWSVEDAVEVLGQ